MELFLLLILSTPTVAEEWIYTVRPGDNLWNLTERHLRSMEYVPQMRQLNGVKNPYGGCRKCQTPGNFNRLG